MTRARAVAMVVALTAVLSLVACTDGGDVGTSGTSTTVARTSIAWTDEQLRFFGPVGRDLVVVTDRTVRTISSAGAPAADTGCCSGNPTLVAAVTDPAGKLWLVRSDGVPIDQHGLPHLAASSITALNGPVTLLRPNTHDHATRAVNPRSVAVVDDRTVVLSTSSVQNESPLSAGHHDDVMIWRVTVGAAPVLIGGMPSNRFLHPYWSNQAFTAGGVDPLEVELDTVQGMLALTSDSYVVLLTQPGVASGSGTPTAPSQQPGMHVAVLASGRLRAISSTASACFDIATNLARQSGSFAVTAKGADPARCLQKSTSVAYRASGPGIAFAFAAGPAVQLGGQNAVVVTESASGITVEWTSPGPHGTS